MESGFLTNIIRQQRNLGAMAFIFTQIAVHIKIDGIGTEITFDFGQKKFPWEMCVLRVLLGDM